ncbi:MAG: hypothetical protein OXN84_09095, partial [Albidovulum sp.]|nr:hypothetical protein [Albidovulum sp.]
MEVDDYESAFLPTDFSAFGHKRQELANRQCAENQHIGFQRRPNSIVGNEQDLLLCPPDRGGAGCPLVLISVGTQQLVHR